MYFMKGRILLDFDLGEVIIAGFSDKKDATTVVNFLNNFIQTEGKVYIEEKLKRQFIDMTFKDLTGIKKEMTNELHFIFNDAKELINTIDDSIYITEGSKTFYLEEIKVF